MNSAKRKQLKIKARREARITLAVEVFGWSVVILGAAVAAKFMYVALVYTRGVYTMNKYKRLLELVLLFAGGFVAGSLIIAVFTLGFRAITAV